MAADSNTGFRREEIVLNRHAISFQSAAINCTAEMIPMGLGGGGGYFGMNTTGGGAGGGGFGCSTSANNYNNNNSSGSSTPVLAAGGLMLPPGSSGLISCSTGGIVQVQAQPHAGSGNSSVAGCAGGGGASASSLVHDTGLAAEWSMEEQYKLEEGLVKYADEPNIMRYIKIAATLREKTVRDVALRCRWMTRKRRKGEEYKKIINRKDKLPEPSSKMNMASAAQQNMPQYPLMMHRMDQTELLTLEGISGTARHLLEQNAQAFSQITSNLSTWKLQDNIDLFGHTRNNIIAVLNDMRGMPGIMSQMPPLDVAIDEHLANSILPNATQSLMFGSPSGIQLKQEPRC